MGKKIMDIKTRRDALRGRKSKARGEKESKATQEYTPLQAGHGYRWPRIALGRPVKTYSGILFSFLGSGPREANNLWFQRGQYLRFLFYVCLSIRPSVRPSVCQSPYLKPQTRSPELQMRPLQPQIILFRPYIRPLRAQTRTFRPKIRISRPLYNHAKKKKNWTTFWWLLVHS